MIDHTSPHTNNAELSSVTFDAYGAAAVFRLMQQLGAGKDTQLVLDERGRLTVITRFRCTSALTPPEGEDGLLVGEQRETLDAWIRKRARAHRLNARKMQRLQVALARANQALEWIKGELHQPKPPTTSSPASPDSACELPTQTTSPGAPPGTGAEAVAPRRRSGETGEVPGAAAPSADGSHRSMIAVPIPRAAG